MYVITADEKKFYAIDEESGGYPYFSPFISNAKIFNSVAQAGHILDGDDFTKSCKFSNGSVMPPRLLHSACGLNKHNTKGKCKISIMEIELVEVFSQEYEAEIKKLK